MRRALPGDVLGRPPRRRRVRPGARRGRPDRAARDRAAGARPAARADPHRRPGPRDPAPRSASRSGTAPTSTRTDLLRRADVAMYEAKLTALGRAAVRRGARRLLAAAAAAGRGPATRDRRRPAGASGTSRRSTRAPRRCSASRRWCAGRTRGRACCSPALFLPDARRSGLMLALSEAVVLMVARRRAELGRGRPGPAGGDELRADRAARRASCCRGCSTPSTRPGWPGETHRRRGDRGVVPRRPRARPVGAGGDAASTTCRWPSTTTARASRRCRTCATCPSRSSRWTGRSSRRSPPTPGAG